jgi:hypothetical protein
MGMKTEERFCGVLASMSGWKGWSLEGVDIGSTVLGRRKKRGEKEERNGLLYCAVPP